MMQLHFLNVGGGDAILLELPGYTMLIDGGRDKLLPAKGTLALTAAEHLRRRGIDHLDTLVVTHLHKDHFGGIRAFLRDVRVDRVYASYFPARPELRIPEDPEAVKTVRGLGECLNLWAETVEALRTQGAQLCPVTETTQLTFAPGLTGEIICRAPARTALQHRTWDGMFAGVALSGERKYWASKSRNPHSLRARLTYQGRILELSGDCYGRGWERTAEPCDIFKVPHHGDKKAVTPELVRRLRPSYAVISCASEHDPRKDRPSMDCIELLRRSGARLWFTDAFQLPGRAADCWDSVDFTITDSGAILAPGSAVAEGGREE